MIYFYLYQLLQQEAALLLRSLCIDPRIFGFVVPGSPVAVV